MLIPSRISHLTETIIARPKPDKPVGPPAKHAICSRMIFHIPFAMCATHTPASVFKCRTSIVGDKTQTPTNTKQRTANRWKNKYVFYRKTRVGGRRQERQDRPDRIYGFDIRHTHPHLNESHRVCVCAYTAKLYAECMLLPVGNIMHLMPANYSAEYVRTCAKRTVEHTIGQVCGGGGGGGAAVLGRIKTVKGGVGVNEHSLRWRRRGGRNENIHKHTRTHKCIIIGFALRVGRCGARFG